MSLLSVSREAMKSTFEVLFERKKYPQGTEAVLNALDEVERLEKVLSVFRFDSKVQLINQTAFHEPVHVDEELFHLIQICQQFAEKTDGAVDITSGALWKQWGFAHRKGSFPNCIPDSEQIEEALRRTGYRHLHLDEEARTVQLLKKGIELNFGCAGKGFALDTAAKKLSAAGIENHIFSGGLSSILAAGKNEKGEIWKTGIAHPLKPGQRLAEIELNNEAVSTSSSAKQFFRYEGHRYSHIIDPRTGFPAEDVFSATVIAPTATEAELLSTAFFVLGFDESERLMKRLAADSRSAVTFSALFVLPIKHGVKYEIKTLGERFIPISCAETETTPQPSKKDKQR
ncbi:MAG: FAD:protein FMN transferase [Planctomycetaceae bacterium]|nr:FAD:protein FMN transferase [Planctomycetaceae bacterium]